MKISEFVGSVKEGNAAVVAFLDYRLKVRDGDWLVDIDEVAIDHMRGELHIVIRSKSADEVPEP